MNMIINNIINAQLEKKCIDYGMKRFAKIWCLPKMNIQIRKTEMNIHE